MKASIDRVFGGWEVSASWHYYGSEYAAASCYWGDTTKTEALKMFRQKMREQHPHAPRIVKFRSL